MGSERKAIHVGYFRMHTTFTGRRKKGPNYIGIEVEFISENGQMKSGTRDH